jgi:hypothetical protein
MRKRKSGECQGWKTWEKQAPETANAEGNKTSREAHKTSKDKNVRGEPKAQQLRSLKESAIVKGVKTSRKTRDAS